MFPIVDYRSYSIDVIERPGKSTMLTLWEFDATTDWSNAIYIDLVSPHIGYTPEQVKKMAEHVEAELRAGNKHAIGLMAGFAASYECYTNKEGKPIANLVTNGDCNSQHHAWVLHTLMALTENAWAV